MGLTFSRMIAELQLGTHRGKIFDVTFDSSYPTGGEDVSKASVGLQNITGALHLGAADATGAGIVPVYKPSTNKLLAMRANQSAHTHDLLLKNAAVADGATTRVNAGANLLGANTGGDLTVAGGGANGGVQANTAADVALSEVANATNLSTVTTRLLFIGN